ncbi:MAG TPA: single-stranded-DNA-specific exonuclease RecJ [Bacillales bacterium]|nr:single-stranded-DNA-specific exonuclease RecJ [Bacillales bacterium]
MLKPKTKWRTVSEMTNEAESLATTLGIAPLVAQLLINRSMNTIERAERFLNVNDQPFNDPFLMKGMRETVDRIQQAITNQEKILVFGDYDADGVTSTAILMSVLREIGANADYYVPNRFTEGYGPNVPALHNAKEEHQTLVITVDTGISAIDEAEAARELGLDFIITDHHQPPTRLPNAFSIVNPHQEDCLYPFKGLSGAGVAFKLAHALLGRVPEHLLDLTVAGTIADLVPLVEENRLIAVRGLTQLEHTERPGLRALLDVSGIAGKKLTAEDVGFTIGPRLNAVGRLDSATPAVRLLLTDKEEEADELANVLEETNRARKRLVDEIADETMEQIEREFPPEDHWFLLAAKEGWNPGVIGIVASRLVERYHRPAIVMSIDEKTGLAKGSARSIEGFDMYRHLAQCSDCLDAFGGHPMAAGMTVKNDRIGELRRRLNELAREGLTEADLVPTKHVDVVCSVDDVSLSLIEQMSRLEPFGTDNPPPTVWIENARLTQIKKVGSDANHLKAVLSGSETSVDAIGFQWGSIGDELSINAKTSVVGRLQVNEWNGFRKPQIVLEDVSVDHWQLFDFRNERNAASKLAMLPEEKRLYVAFRSDTRDQKRFETLGKPFFCLQEQTVTAEQLCGRYVVLLDVPHNVEAMKKLFQNAAPDRIYAVFHHDATNFFSTLPTRDHFKWLYGLLLQRKTLNLGHHAESLAKQKGWSIETVLFMAEVFEELEFATWKNGILTAADRPQKRELSESQLVKERKRQAEVEHLFCYASSSSLKNWFETILDESEMLEEAVQK